MLNFEDFNNFNIFLSINKTERKILESSSEENDDLLFEVKEDVERCIAKIMGKYKFFGRFVYRLRIVYTYRIPTMAVDEFQNLFINPIFAKGLTDRQMMFVICHEIIHLVLTHIPRGKVKGALPDDNEGWNYAADYETNAILIDEGLMTAEEVKQMGALYEEKYSDMIAEAIYDEKPPKQKNDNNMMFPAEIGDFIKIKDTNEYGRITAINANGTYRFKPVTKDEVRKALTSK